MKPRRVNPPIRVRLRPADRGWLAVSFSCPRSNRWGIVWVRWRRSSAACSAHKRREAPSATLRVGFGSKVSSGVFPAEGQPVHVHRPKLIACLVGALQFDPLEFIGLRVAMA